MDDEKLNEEIESNIEEKKVENVVETVPENPQETNFEKSSEEKSENFAQKSFLDFSQSQALQTNQNKLSESVEAIVSADMQKVRSMVQLGLINPLQGQNLMNQVINKAYDTVLQKEDKKPTSTDATRNSISNETLNFFEGDGRRDVLNYLKDNNIAFDNDGFSKIQELVSGIEKTAVERYLKNLQHEKDLEKQNTQAKQRLSSNAQSQGAAVNDERAFTREQIGQMSIDEFSKYEKSIMAQLKKGQIR